MISGGRLIAIEGIDGSGKRTQLKLLSHALEARGIELMRIGFPRYESSFGKLVGQFLDGEFGPLEAVDPHFSALLYAGDRFEAKREMDFALAKGKVIIADRYVASNLAHQTARVPPDRRDEFVTWLKHVEYGIYGLRVEDLVIYLRVPVSEAQRMVGMKSRRAYTALQHDLLEADVTHLEQAAAVYDRLSTAANWVRIDCADSSGDILPPDKIHRAVLDAVDSRIVLRAIAQP
jgi:dTMP kinase